MQIHYTLNENEIKLLLNWSSYIRADTKEAQLHEIRERAHLYRPMLGQLTTFLNERVVSCFGPGFSIIDEIPLQENSPWLSACITSLLGTIRKEYSHGVWIKEIKYQKEAAHQGLRPSANNSEDFFLHTDLSYTKHAPKYFTISAIANAKQIGGASTVCPLINIMQRLSSETIEELCKASFIFPAPKYFKKNHDQIDAILALDETGNYHIRFRRDGIKALTKSGIMAVKQLIKVINDIYESYFLETDSMMIINNTTCLHGRQSFAPERMIRDSNRHFIQLYAD